MKIIFEGDGKITWGKAKVFDLDTDKQIENVAWVDTEFGVLCYFATNDEGKFIIVGVDAPDWHPQRLILHGRFKVEITSKPAHPNLKGKVFESQLVEIEQVSDRPVQRVIHPEQPTPNTQSVKHQVDIEKEASNDGKSEGEGTSCET